MATASNKSEHSRRHVGPIVEMIDPKTSKPENDTLNAPVSNIGRKVNVVTPHHGVVDGLVTRETPTLLVVTFQIQQPSGVIMSVTQRFRKDDGMQPGLPSHIGVHNVRIEPLQGVRSDDMRHENTGRKPSSGVGSHKTRRSSGTHHKN